MTICDLCKSNSEKERRTSQHWDRNVSYPNVAITNICMYHMITLHPINMRKYVPIKSKRFQYVLVIHLKNNDIKNIISRRMETVKQILSIHGYAAITFNWLKHLFYISVRQDLEACYLSVHNSLFNMNWDNKNMLERGKWPYPYFLSLKLCCIYNSVQSLWIFHEIVAIDLLSFQAWMPFLNILKVLFKEQKRFWK